MVLRSHRKAHAGRSEALDRRRHAWTQRRAAAVETLREGAPRVHHQLGSKLRCRLTTPERRQRAPEPAQRLSVTVLVSVTDGPPPEGVLTIRSLSTI